MASLNKSGTKYMRNIGIPKSDYENFNFRYSSDLLTKFLLKCIDKANHSRLFLEFVMFDDVLDFRCNRGDLFPDKYLEV